MSVLEFINFSPEPTQTQVQHLTNELQGRYTGRREYVAYSELDELSDLVVEQLEDMCNDPQWEHWVEDGYPFFVYGEEVYFEVDMALPIIYEFFMPFPAVWEEVYLMLYGINFDVLNFDVPYDGYLKTLHEQVFPDVPFAETVDRWLNPQEN